MYKLLATVFALILSVSFSDTSFGQTKKQMDKMQEDIKSKIDSTNSSSQVDMIKLQSQMKKRNDAMQSAKDAMQKQKDAKEKINQNMR